MEMNGLYLVIASALILVIAYRLYGSFVAAKVLTVNQYRTTPAVAINDGVDYVPTNKWVTFGQHFAAIAGAGPLVGPVIAAQFGYLPGVLWILIGSVLAGAVHDFVLLLHPFVITVNPLRILQNPKFPALPVWARCLLLCSCSSSRWPVWQP